MTLEELKSAGVFPVTYESVDFSKAVSIKAIQEMTKEDQASFDGAVVVDNCIWAATARKTPIGRANSIYSCSNDGTFGYYRKDSRVYYSKELVNNSLTNTNIYNLEDQKMDQSVQFNPEDFGAQVAQSATSFNSDVTATADGKVRVDHVAEHNQLISDVKKKAGVGSGAGFVNNTDIWLNNQTHGRFIAFITKTDSVVKAAISVKKDKETKAVVSKDIIFKSAAPGQPRGAIIKTPEGSDISLSKLAASEEILNDENKKDMKVHFMSIEAAETYLARNYNGQIREDEAVLGEKASTIVCKFTPSTTKEGEPTIKASLALGDKDKRKTLLTEGNYIPTQAFKTFSTVSPSEAEKKSLDLNIRALLCGTTEKGHTYEQLSDASKAEVKLTDDDTVTTSWFDNNKPISVVRYDDKETTVSDVRIPAREVKVSEAGKKTYKYQYLSPEETIQDPKYKKIIAATGLSDDVILAKLKQFTAKKSGGGRKREELTADVYLQGLRNGTILINGKLGGLDEIIAEIARDSDIR